MEHGHVVCEITVENLGDRLVGERVRHAVISDALIDTAEPYLSLPGELIRRLGLMRIDTRIVTTAAGRRRANFYGPIRLAILDRECGLDAIEVPDAEQPRVGRIPLHALDLVVDPVSRRLVGNPAHGGEHVVEQF